jgi:DNA helicase-2/ATP-dependent DNA helicase PcrA
VADTSFSLRPSQEEILKYRSGKMGISAVPGSGKTWTLSMLAANIILSGRLGIDQEVLIVTLVNSAVNNFTQRISQRLKEEGLLPNLGYRVRTLHGLAHDIVRERPDLAGLSTDFTIIDERESANIKSNIAQTFLRVNPNFFTRFFKEDLNENDLSKVLNKHLPTLMLNLTNIFIRTAKDFQLSPDLLRDRMAKAHASLPLVEMGLQLYQDYQQALNYRAGVDFDDLTRLALQCLQFDPRLINSLRSRWPYILEDEAQDSSHLQQQILALLADKDGNWVRVGDPNQAIYETFTTADPRLLRDFINREDVISADLPESGRSTTSIISLANFLIDWTHKEHFNENARDALSLPHIQPTPANGPQPNPPDDPAAIQFLETKFSPDAELAWIQQDVREWLIQNPEATTAILAPSNHRGYEVVDSLRSKDIPVIDSLLSSATSTRLSAGAIANILYYLSDPQSPGKLATAYKVWRREDRADEAGNVLLDKVVSVIRKCTHVEDFLWSFNGDAWLANLPIEPDNYDNLVDFRNVVRRWQAAALLPIDQLVLTIAQDLFLDPVELAMAHKLALTLRQMANTHPQWQLPELGEELKVIAKNERRFLGFSDDENGFNPDAYRGKVVVATMHKAKGLEWDKIYLISVNNYDFPSGNEYDAYYAEKWFVRNNLNLEAETQAQLETLIRNDPFNWYMEGEASQKARDEYIRERLRLLYVGITRARKALTITWNTGRRGNVQEAIPLIALRNFWKGQP